MYKVVIADDEVWVAIGIKKLIHRSSLPFEVVGEASNGIKALEMVREMRQDLLITDIRMPGLNGLELVKRIRESESLIQIIFISGYAEFEYAKEGLRLGALDYLLKPVEEESLRKVLLRYQAAREEKTKQAAQPESEEAGFPIEDYRIKKVVDEINIRYTEKISLQELADKCGLSSGHLSALIKRETGASFSDYVAAKRIGDAKKLLLQEGLSIEEVAYQVGYHDYFYFTKVFKKHEGISPSAFRKQQSARLGS